MRNQKIEGTARDTDVADTAADQQVSPNRLGLGTGTEVSQRKRQDLLAELHKKISLSAEFVALVEDLQTEKPGNIPTALKEFKSRARDQYPEVNDELIKELRELSSSGDAQYLGRYCPELLAVKSIPNADDYLSRAERFEELHRNSDLVYVDRLLRLCDSLEEKAEVVAQHTRNPFKIDAKIRKMVRDKLGKSYLRFFMHIPMVSNYFVKSIDHRNFAIVVDLPERVYKGLIGKDSAGVMFPGTPFCFIRGGRTERERELTIEHEVVHQIIDGNQDWVSHVPPARLLEQTYLPLIEALERNKEQRNPNELDAARNDVLEILDDISDADLCRYMRHEYYASLDALRGVIKSFKSVFVDTENEDMQKSFGEQMQAGLMSSLTYQHLEGIQLLQGYRQSTTADWAKPALIELEKQLIDSLAKHLLFPYMVVNEIETQVDDDAKKVEVLHYAHAALRTFEPTKAQRIFDLLASEFNFQYPQERERESTMFIDQLKLGVKLAGGTISLTECGFVDPEDHNKVTVPE